MHQTFVIIGAVFVAFFNFGIMQAYGALFTDTLERFGEGRAKTSLIYSVLVGTSFGAGVFAGYLIKRTKLIIVSTIGSVLLPLGFIVSYFATSVTFLIISIGIISGFGISFTYVSSVVMLGTVISEKHKTSALSLQNVACGAPGIIVPYFFAWLAKTYNLPGTFLIYGGITLNNFAVSILFSGVKAKGQTSKGHEEVSSETVIENHIEPNNRDSQTTTDSPDRAIENTEDGIEKGQSVDGTHNGQASQRTVYIIFVIGATVVMANIGGIQALSQDIGVYKGLSADEALSCISAFNIASTAGRFFPLIFQKLSQNPFSSPIVASLSGVLGQAIIMMASHYYVVLIGYMLTGFTDGGVSSSMAVVIYKVLSKDAQTMGFGFLLSLIGIFATASGPIYGAMFDQTESYALVLSITTTSFAIGSVLFVACFVLCGNVCMRRYRQYIFNKN